MSFKLQGFTVLIEIDPKTCRYLSSVHSLAHIKLFAYSIHLTLISLLPPLPLCVLFLSNKQLFLFAPSSPPLLLNPPLILFSPFLVCLPSIYICSSNPLYILLALSLDPLLLSLSLLPHFSSPQFPSFFPSLSLSLSLSDVQTKSEEIAGCRPIHARCYYCDR